MHFLSVILVIASVGANVAAVANDGVETHRVLRAATKKADFYRRGVRIAKRFETEMAYVDNENVWTDASTFASQVKVGSQKPVFNLEEYEHHLQGVECSQVAMKLHFVDASSARDARAACHGDDGGLIITSHSGCNEEGERSVYRVNNVSFAEDGEALEVSVVKTTWQEAFDHVNVTFGHTTDDHIYRRHADFARIRRKRQGRVEIPADTPDDVNTAEFDLTAEITDTTFGSVNFLDIISDIVPVPGLPINVPIELGCTKCSTKGQLALSQGAFNIDASQIDLIPDIFQGGDDGKEISSVITGGFMELVATGVGAHLELFARPASNGAFEVVLFSVPIVGFTIPGIGKAGAIFEPRVRFDFKVGGGVEVHYGLDINVPDGSSLRVELTDLSSSSLTGFQDTTFTPLPVSVNITDIELLLGLAFKPTIPIGFEFFDQLKAEVTASLDLPRLDAKLTTATPENCGGADNVAAPGPPFSNMTTNLSKDPITLGPLALAEANVSISCDVGFDVGLPLLPPPFNSVSVSQNIFKAVFPLISECTSPEGAFNNSSSLVIPPPMGSETTSAMPIMNATATPAFNTTSSGVPVVDTTATPAFNKTSSTLIADTTATYASVAASMNAAATQEGYAVSSTAMLNATASMTSTISSATSISNVTAILPSANIPTTSTCNDTAILTSKILATISPSNATSVLASSTALAMSTLNTTTTLASSTLLTTSSLNTTSTAMLNYTMSTTLISEPTETSCKSRSTTTLTNTSYVTSRITRETTVTPPASTTSLDSTVVFTLLSTSGEKAATETSVRENSSASESLVQESSSSVDEATSTPQILATSTTEITSTFSSSTPESYSLPSPSTLEASTSIESSAPPPSSSAAESSTTPSSSIALSATAFSTTSASPTLPAPAESLPPPAAVVTMGVGFLVPSNASALPVQQSGITEFTGAATKNVQLLGPKVLLGLVLGLVGFGVVGVSA